MYYSFETQVLYRKPKNKNSVTNIVGNLINWCYNIINLKIFKTVESAPSLLKRLHYWNILAVWMVPKCFHQQALKPFFCSLRLVLWILRILHQLSIQKFILATRTDLISLKLTNMLPLSVFWSFVNSFFSSLLSIILRWPVSMCLCYLSLEQESAKWHGECTSWSTLETNFLRLEICNSLNFYNI